MTSLFYKKAQIIVGTGLWMRELPHLSFAEPNRDFQLISEEDMREVLKDVSPAIVEEIMAELQDIDHVIMRLFGREITRRANSRIHIVCINLGICSSLQPRQY